MAGRFWRRWKRFAHRAAEIQSLVILTALYWIVVVPIGLVRRPRRRDSAPPPRWKTREPVGPIGVEAARRQF
jgi:hypothetical protein